MHTLLPLQKKHAKCIEIRLLQQSSVTQTKSKSFIEKVFNHSWQIFCWTHQTICPLSSEQVETLP
jgi:hypothetical protein